MGDWVIHIEGTGPHHNGKNPLDANQEALEFVKQLRNHGQKVRKARFTASDKTDDLIEVLKDR